MEILNLLNFAFNPLLNGVRPMELPRTEKLTSISLSPSPLLDGHFLSTFHPQMRYLYHFKALVAGNSNIWSIGSSMECHEIITKHFFSCPSSWREFWHFFCLFIFRCRVSRQTKKKLRIFLAFLKIKWLFTFLDIWSLIWHSFDDDAHHFIEFSVLCQ